MQWHRAASTASMIVKTSELKEPPLPQGSFAQPFDGLGFFCGRAVVARGEPQGRSP